MLSDKAADPITQGQNTDKQLRAQKQRQRNFKQIVSDRNHITASLPDKVSANETLHFLLSILPFKKQPAFQRYIGGDSSVHSAQQTLLCLFSFYKFQGTSTCGGAEECPTFSYSIYSYLVLCFSNRSSLLTEVKYHFHNRKSWHAKTSCAHLEVLVKLQHPEKESQQRDKTWL